jgi:hypothetical protein
MKWEIANSGGIEINPETNSWHAGRVSDIIRVKDRGGRSRDRGTILVAAPDSGVWAMQLENGVSTPLSMDWENPHVTCLGSGFYGDHHIFAGCGYQSYEGAEDEPTGGALYESDVSNPIDPNPVYRRWRRIPLPVPPNQQVGSINDIVVLKNKRTVILACWGGIMWSRIPDLPGGMYSWKAADWKSYTSIKDTPPHCFSVTIGPGSTIIAGAWTKSQEKRGIFTGEFGSDLFGNPILYMYPTKIKDWSPVGFKGLPAEAAMFRVSVASCDTRPNYVYALSTSPSLPPSEYLPAGQKRGKANMILSSEDGGQNWIKCELKIAEAPKEDFKLESILDYGDDGSGDEIHTIGVSPWNPSRVAFGIQEPFHSIEGGKNWYPLRPWSNANPQVTHCHADIHVIYFDPIWDGQIFIGSDGGLISTTDNGLSFMSYYNRNLYNLLFYSTHERHFYGKICASPWSPNIIGGGLHDNGNVYCTLDAQGIRTPWKKLDFGDGGEVVCTSIEDLIIHSCSWQENETKERFATWDIPEYKLVTKGYIPVRSPSLSREEPGPVISEFIPWARIESVFNPHYRNKAEQLMFAVAVADPLTPHTEAVPGTSAQVFGLFAGSDGNDIHWEPIIDPNWTYPWGTYGGGTAGLPGGTYRGGGSGAGSGFVEFKWWFRAAGSFDGHRVFFSTQDSENTTRIYTLRPKDGTVQGPFSLPPHLMLPEGGVITQFAVLSDKVALATYNYAVTGAGYLIRTRNSGEDWEKVDGFPLVPATGTRYLFGLDYDYTTSPKTLYVSTETSVWVSKDNGLTWNDFSNGLPECPNCGDLRYVELLDGTRFLYLGTWGWSVWRIRLG